MAASPPQFLSVARHRDERRPLELAVRRAVIAILVAISAAGLLNVFGQEAATSRAAAAGAVLEVEAPTALRGGLFYQGRFTVEARSALEAPTLVLHDGWLVQTHINTIEPAAEREESRDGRLALEYGPLAAGRRMVVFLQFQVNPTNVGRRSQDVELWDGDRRLAAVDRAVTVYP